VTIPGTKENERLSPVYAFLQVLICFLWGANLVSIRISNQGIPPLLAAASRSVIAAGLLWLYARFSGLSLFFDKEHSSNHDFLRCWNAEVKVDEMTLLLPQDCYIDSRDYAALSSSLLCP
jgi:hypothetical protein